MIQTLVSRSSATRVWRRWRARPGFLALPSLLLACSDPGADKLEQQASALAGAAQIYDGHPAVGLLSFVTAPTRLSHCTGTLVGPCWVLTAAHCVNKAERTPENTRFRPAASVTTEEALAANSGARVTRFIPYPEIVYVEDGRAGDIALVRLHEPDCPFTKPIRLARREPEQGMELTLIGYGITGATRRDYGTKRIGVNRVHKVTTFELQLVQADDSAAMLCEGDSGGPGLARYDVGELQIGVHSRVSASANEDVCGDTSTGYESRVDRYLDWLLEQSGGQLLVEDAGDEKPPLVQFDWPKDGAVVDPPRMDVEISASDDTRVAYIDVYLDDRAHRRLVAPPYRVDAIEIKRLTPLKIEARAVDATGKESTAIARVRGSGRDGVPPSVSFVGLKDGDSIGSTATVGVEATDDVAVRAVALAIDGRWLPSALPPPPYRFQLDLPPASNVRLTARASDDWGNEASTTITVRTLGEPGGADARPADGDARAELDASADAGAIGLPSGVGGGSCSAWPSLPLQPESRREGGGAAFWLALFLGMGSVRFGGRYSGRRRCRRPRINRATNRIR